MSDKNSLGKPPVRRLPSRTQRFLAVCGKCSRKLDGGFGSKNGKSLTKALRREVPDTKGKRAAIRIIETGCLDICPKHAVALFDSSRPGEVAIVAAHTPIETVVTDLGLPQRADPAALSIPIVG